MNENVDPNLDKTSKNGVVWTKLKCGEDLSLRKKINFTEKPGPTSYATRNIDSTKLSAFLMIFDTSMINFIVQCTNSNAKNYENVTFINIDILAFIGILFFRGVLSKYTSKGYVG
ncbi:unnamed protein product [Brachionus calyciflorus]|uniref:Uncharacterized protein n=1 Tax=Brachionus calyciflorus TaxID=104777 RepID=A0A814MYN3_9BILA|nr:unnamed protein product [Brachionus calyciflorus]